MDCELFDPRDERWVSAETCHREAIHHPRKGGSSTFLGELSVSQFRLRFVSLTSSDNQSLVYKKGFLLPYEIPVTSIYRVVLLNKKKKQKKEFTVSDVARFTEELEYSSMLICCSDFTMFKFSTVTENKNFPQDFLEMVLRFGVRLNPEEQFGMLLGKKKNKSLEAVRANRDRDGVWMTEFPVRSLTFPQDERKDVTNGAKSSNVIDHSAFLNNRMPAISCTFGKKPGASMIVRCGKILKGKRNIVEQEIRRACKAHLNNAAKPGDTEKLVRFVKLREHLPRLEEVNQGRRRLREICLGYDPDSSNTNWLDQLDSTQWMTFVSRTLKLAADFADELRRDPGKTLVLSEGTDSDWNCVICSLVHLLLFPHLRSVSGLKELIVREWCAARHLFSYRQETAVDGANEKRAGPLFPLFLDCVQQLWNQFPHCFTFSPDFLIVLHDLSHAGLFREFLLHIDKRVGVLLPSVFDLKPLLSEDGLLLMSNPVFDLAVEMWRVEQNSGASSEAVGAGEPSTAQLLEAVRGNPREFVPDADVRFLYFWRENYLRALSFLDIGQAGRAAELWRYRELLHLVRSGRSRAPSVPPVLGLLDQEEAADVGVLLRNEASRFRLPSGCDLHGVTAFFPFSKETIVGIPSRASCYPDRGVSHFDMTSDTTF